MKTIDPTAISITELHGYLQYTVAPRPICFASTVNAAGNVNLSPYSFFNIFSTNPPVVIFSPSRRVRDNTIKHTLENIRQVPEVAINVVNYPMVQQTSLASTEYPGEVNEFVKAGFTEIASEIIRPPRVAESPVQFECVVTNVIALGDGPGAGNLVLAEVKRIHLAEDLLENGTINQAKLDLVARLGGDWYCRVTPESLFKVAKPLVSIGIGVDAIPARIRTSRILTGNDLGKLGNISALPADLEIAQVHLYEEVKDILDATIGDQYSREVQLTMLAKRLLENDDVENAWKVLLA
ncbi:flavin reductase family protein [Hufsiella ginkgonis]|uniref:Flavin reductase family protein n=1 Tax=Hufsiella ginkgonis TaxID=2695274 RepID=A0A7K1XUG5_9SPHI|nr:flavin reductase family protein [Hufsiella ginkgonis]MXV14653.1 flavin reductase family protein [Hufsiella ginkgonis]